MAVVASAHARALLRKDLHARKVVRDILPRDGVATTEDGRPIVNKLPVSSRVLAAFFVILGVLIIGIVSWRVIVWKRRKSKAASQKFRQNSFIPSEKSIPFGEGMPMEKQDVLVILPMEPPATAQNTSAKWVPQFPKGYHSVSAVVDVKEKMVEAIRSPPPNYSASNSPTSSPSSSPRPPALNLPVLTITHDDSNMLSVPAMPTPVPSPRRTSSFVTDTPIESNFKPKPSIKGKKLPRKMLVEHTFIPSLADELSIKVGEVLSMLEEYEDEWCLVERLGARSNERGVVPRFCLQERPRGGHKRGQSSTSAPASKMQ